MKKAQTTIRFPEEWLRHIDAVAKQISTEWSMASRNDALCYLILKGIEATTQTGQEGAQ